MSNYINTTSATSTRLDSCAEQGSLKQIAKLEECASAFDSIRLWEMESVALLARVDTKLVLPAETLLALLPSLEADYRVLNVAGRCLNHYRTLYFDSKGFDLYHMHVNDRAERYKVRCREYMDTKLSYLEVKHHNRKGRTLKSRLQTNRPVFRLAADHQAWLKQVYPSVPGDLQPKLWNTFTRVTLVRWEERERLTLDLDLAFFAEDQAARMHGLAIAEVKLDSESKASPFLALMQANRLRPSGFSKYTMGVSLLYAQVKKNALKPKLLKLGRLYGDLSHEFVY